MGQCMSGPGFVVREDVGGQDKESLSIIESLKFSKSDIDKLYRAFKKCDIDNSDNIQNAELFASYSLEVSPVYKKIFALFDEDNSGEINFLEFVISHWNFLTLSKDDIGVMAFMMVDPHGKRQMELPELKSLIETLHGKSIESVPILSNAFNELLKNFSGRFTFSEFVRWSGQNPAICAPLYAFKINIMTKLLGQEFWSEKQKQRYADKEMKEPHYVFKFQRVVTAIHDRVVREAALKKLHEQIAEVRGYGGDKNNGKDRKQDVLMDKFGLGDKKPVRKGVNVIGDVDKAILEGEDILIPTVETTKKDKDTAAKSGRATIAKKSDKQRPTVVSASGKVVPVEGGSEGATSAPAASRKSTKGGLSVKAGATSEKVGATSEKAHDAAPSSDTTDGIVSSASKSRKTILAPIENAPTPSSAPVDGQARRGRSTFVQKKPQ